MTTKSDIIEGILDIINDNITEEYKNPVELSTASVLQSLYKQIKALSKPSIDGLPGTPSPEVEGERWMRGYEVPDGWEWHGAHVSGEWYSSPAASGIGIVVARPVTPEEQKTNCAFTSDAIWRLYENNDSKLRQWWSGVPTAGDWRLVEAQHGHQLEGVSATPFSYITTTDELAVGQQFRCSPHLAWQAHAKEPFIAVSTFCEAIPVPESTFGTVIHLPLKPQTEKIPALEAVGRKLEDGSDITSGGELIVLSYDGGKTFDIRVASQLVEVLK